LPYGATSVHGRVDNGSFGRPLAASSAPHAQGTAPTPNRGRERHCTPAHLQNPPPIHRPSIHHARPTNSPSQSPLFPGANKLWRGGHWTRDLRSRPTPHPPHKRRLSSESRFRPIGEEHNPQRRLLALEFRNGGVIRGPSDLSYAGSIRAMLRDGARAIPVPFVTLTALRLRISDTSRDGAEFILLFRHPKRLTTSPRLCARRTSPLTVGKPTTLGFLKQVTPGCGGNLSRPITTGGSPCWRSITAILPHQSTRTHTSRDCHPRS
jgi:hypothetical protein